MVEASGKVFAGEYDIDIYHEVNPVILDIGANIGAFSRWAKLRWPGSTIHAYEPSPHCFSILRDNTKDLPDVHCNQVAIGASNGNGFLYHGTHNRGMSSMIKSEHTRDTGDMVEVVDASTLPAAQIVKCDVEGMEFEILPKLRFSPDLLLVEFHSIQIRKQIENLYQENFWLYEYRMQSPTAGCLKFINHQANILK